MRECFIKGSEPALICVGCQASFGLATEMSRCSCGSLLEIRHPRFAADFPSLLAGRGPLAQPSHESGVWRYNPYVVPLSEDHIVTHPEGNTRIYTRAALNAFAGVDWMGFKHEGENPTGSFKDRGMTVAVSQARSLGRRLLGCASTGNTSAALAAYAAQCADVRALVFLPAGKVAAGKLAQAVAYGAVIVGVEGDFDTAMELVQTAARDLGLYLVNSINPFRLEGQKTVMWEMLEQLQWQPPDWVVVPGGNLGNTSAFGKALLEAHEAGWIKTLPRLAVVQAAGASPFYTAYQSGFAQLVPSKAETIASAIRIGNPVNYTKAAAALGALRGVVTAVSDDEVLVAKARIDGAGIGCEPASACTLAGVKRLVGEGIIRPSDRVVGVLTGHILKDTDAIALACKRPLDDFKPDVFLRDSLKPLQQFLNLSKN
jgi:threonine synthase